MTAEQLFRFSVSIQKSLEETQRKESSIRNDLLVAAETQPAALVDQLDHARADADINTRLELHSRNTVFRIQLQAALKRISDGTFGLCIQCEEEIALRRLEAHPTAMFCLACQTWKENEKAAKTHPSLQFRSPEVADLSLFIA